MKPPAPLSGLFCGAGHFAKIQLDAWKAVPAARIVALYNRTLDRARALQAEFGIDKISDDLAALLDSVRPNFVDICTAAETHLPLARAAAERGIPVLCQKPLAPSLAEAEQLVAACEAHQVRLMANDNWRWQGWYRELKRLIEAGTIGEPRHARFVLRPGDGAGEEPYPLQPFFRDMERFVLLETGGHYLDTIRFLVGEISALHCITRRRNPRIRGEDAALVTLEFANGATAVFDADRTAPTSSVRPPVNGHAVIEGDTATLRLDEDGAIFIQLRGRPEERHTYAIPAGYRGGSAIAAQTHFVESLRAGTRFETEGRDYLAIERAVDACYRSAASGTTERLEKAS
jgi:Predicted dehydrogenases and related proteins